MHRQQQPLERGQHGHQEQVEDRDAQEDRAATKQQAPSLPQVGESGSGRATHRFTADDTDLPREGG